MKKKIRVVDDEDERARLNCTVMSGRPSQLNKTKESIVTDGKSQLQYNAVPPGVQLEQEVSLKYGSQISRDSAEYGLLTAAAAADWLEKHTTAYTARDVNTGERNIWKLRNGVFVKEVESGKDKAATVERNKPPKSLRTGTRTGRSAYSSRRTDSMWKSSGRPGRRTGL